MIKLYRRAKGYTTQVIIILVLVSVSTICELFLPSLMSNIINIGIANQDTDYIMKTGFLMLIITVFGSIIGMITSFLTAKTSIGMITVLRKLLFMKVNKFALQEFNQIGTSSLITRTTNDITQIQSYLVMFLRVIARAPIMALGGIIMAYLKSPRLTLIFILLIVIMILIVFFIARTTIPFFKVIQDNLDYLNLVLRERLGGIRVIRAFNKEEYEEERFNKANDALTNTLLKVTRTMAILSPTIAFSMNIVIVAIVWFGSSMITKNPNLNFKIGDLIAFVEYVINIMFSLTVAATVLGMLPRASASSNRINQVFAINDSLEKADTPIDVNPNEVTIEFKNVSFSYPGACKKVLNNISFISNPREITSFIGGTGSGKSTILNLILRFYDATEGIILINGIDIKKLDLHKLRDMIGYVPQKASLFSGSVNSNIKAGKEFNQEEIIEAAKIAKADNFIENMKHGFNSTITQKGSNLSGGQKQRLSIARAIVKRAGVYLFDDTFSALDFKTEASLRHSLKNEIKHSTILIAGQRISSIMNSNQIIVLDDGKIVGIGKHDDLLKDCKVYQEIAASQLSKGKITYEE